MFEPVSNNSVFPGFRIGNAAQTSFPRLSATHMADRSIRRCVVDWMKSTTWVAEGGWPGPLRIMAAAAWNSVRFAGRQMTAPLPSRRAVKREFDMIATERKNNAGQVEWPLFSTPALECGVLHHVMAIADCRISGCLCAGSPGAGGLSTAH